ncbi:Survival protein SurE [Beutenbergia cavernae DSM 12333]|uniref:5'-nucleotidase n=1 Tax=Beutenbergia cavernae (strain ATCC BAA-8 / DSM 12333 / CCUG 43141 / JCM 11478 / NBRC 16432 / NCIMB 13614 / HKI 0122) TaxID=471853 RepID=C5C2B1_BEUC1|nr:5'/3'-nucleotidase SurE [Beutenbergia cavernae]ACQ81736.1 Survival protein SurE [Beutenbergia cavernae DSM 12333]
MRALVTNDDGVASPGLAVLADVAREVGCDVVVAAPNREYSGASASLIGHEAEGRLRLAAARPPGLPDDVPAFAVRAAPALITFTASYGAFGPKPDLVLSGVNLGANTGHATLHSGTVGAALSAATQGITAMAVSIASPAPRHLETARAYTRRALDWLLEQPPLGDRVLNLNVPDLPMDAVRGMRPARLATFGAVQGRVKEKGHDYVTLTYSGLGAGTEDGSDAFLLARGWATLTLLRAPVSDDAGVQLPRVDGHRAADWVDGGELGEVSAGRTMSPGA